MVKGPCGVAVAKQPRHGFPVAHMLQRVDVKDKTATISKRCHGFDAMEARPVDKS